MAGPLSISGAWNAARRMAAFAYDAVQSKGRRKAPDGILRSEDAELDRTSRRKLLSSARDIHRNFSIAAWAVRKHLDYTTTFNFQPKTGLKAHDRWLSDFVRRTSKAQACDVAGRHPLRRFMRIAEARRILDGDLGLLKLRTGHLQAIEGDRICTPYGGPPPGIPADQILHGVQVGDVGQAIAYCICRRGRVTDWGQLGTDFQFERLVPAEHLWLHAHFDRFDQVRGVSPIACALNNLRDTYEGLDYILMRMKLQQLFGLVMYRGDPAAITREAHTNDETQDYSTIQLNGARILDLDIGDRAEFLESKAPAAETQAFIQQMIAIVLKSLDIPFSFYAEDFSSYSGSRQALLQYEQSASNSRMDVQDRYDDRLEWRLQIADYHDEIPAGMKISDLAWEHVSAGLPWIDPLKEMQANVAGLNAGIRSRTRICRERGEDFFTIADELKLEADYLAELGLTTTTEQDASLTNALLAAGAQHDG